MTILELLPREGVRVFKLIRDDEPATEKQSVAELAEINRIIPWGATVEWRGHVFERPFRGGPRTCWKCSREYSPNYRFNLYPLCTASEVKP